MVVTTAVAQHRLCMAVLSQASRMVVITSQFPASRMAVTTTIQLSRAAASHMVVITAMATQLLPRPRLVSVLLVLLRQRNVD